MSLLSRLAVQAARAYGMLVSGSANNVTTNFLVVAGGGGGGASEGGGGGGAGGYRTSAGTSGGGAFAESAITLSALNTYTITVGAGGNGGSGGTVGANGSNSFISGTGLTTLTSVGGGGGGNNSGASGSSGGSGGGGGFIGGGSASAGGTPTANQGFAGGLGSASSPRRAGGGGGAGVAGATGLASGNGGNGVASSITGSSVTYAGGGGGGSEGSVGGTGGTGGGGSTTGALGGNGNPGTANLGGGGGGANRGTPGTGSFSGGAGGSGIVIISYASATPRFVGGTLTTSGGNQIHTFTSSGTLSPITPITASYLVVAGGGGAGRTVSGGGGGGGYLTSSTTLYSGATYVVTVGGGGAVGATFGARGTNGGNSIISGTGLTTITSLGGGGGGADGSGTVAERSGSSGGSGGGAVNVNGVPGAGTSGQGNAGGNGSTNCAGGGGGAGAVGGNGSGNIGGTGGNGLSSSISGTSTFYAGGGGGGGYNTASINAGGLGGGGNGTNDATNSTPGTPNSGGGGGGAGFTGAPAGTSASGGSGIVIISYAGSQAFNGGLVTSSGGNTIHTFTSTGALTPLTNNLTNSLRFRSSASAYLNRTLSTPTNNKIWTWSAWVKRGALGGNYGLFSSASSGTGYTTIRFNGADYFEILQFDGAAYNYYFATSQLFRDPSAWYHIVVSMDTTQATAANRMKLYVNGNQVTAFSSSPVAVVYPTQNLNTNINSAVVHRIGANNYTGTVEQPFDGYQTDINFIDGQALEPYFFGNNDANGVWKPIQYRGTYGTNGFYLNFSNTTSTTTLGFDSSPNGNNWTTNNISLTAGTTYDAMTDVPTNTSATTANYATMNPLETGDGAPAALSNGNLTITGSSSLYLRRGTMNFPATGKYYCEFTVTAVGSGVSIAYDSRGQNGATQFIQYDNAGTKNVNGTTTSYGASYTTGDVIALAVDADGGNIYFYKNNTSQGAISLSSASMTGVNATAMVFAFTSAIVNANFGQRPFAYTPPTGFVALNTFNLPTPTILQGNRFMDATTYTSTGTSQVIVNQGQFKPDLVWTKARNSSSNHVLNDSVRGAANYLSSNLTNAEAAASTYLTSFDAGGYSIGSGNFFANGTTIVGWQWQAGQGTNTSNTSGSITSTVSVNTTAGFSIVTYTGNGVNGATFGHGLGAVPRFIIIKTRTGSSTNFWICYHRSLTATSGIYLNRTDAIQTFSDIWNNTEPTSSVVTLGTTSNDNTNGSTYVAYCWAEIAGFSRFGSYTGNGSADGPFIFTNFQPEFVLIKRTNTTGNWRLVDTTRSTFNATQNELYPNLSNAEGTATYDILSNGFKLRETSADYNASGGTYIFMAFASNPFKISNAR